MLSQTNENVSLKPKNMQVRQIQSTSYLSLYKYASTADCFWIMLSLLGGLENGLSMPIYSIIFGNLTDSYAFDDDETKLHKATLNILYMAILGVCSFGVTFLMYAAFSISTENQVTRLRKKYFASLLRKDAAWYDNINTNSLNTKVNSQILAISEAIGEKTVTFAFSLASFISGFLIGYINGWKLALVITSTLPVLALTIVFLGYSSSLREQLTINSDLQSSAQVEEVLNSIKTVKMLDGEDFELKKFTTIISHSSKSIIKYGLYYGLSFGAMFGFQQWTYALGVFYTGQLMQDQVNPAFEGQVYSSGSICTVFFSILMGSFSLGYIGPCLSSFTKGKLAASEVFEVIEEDDEKQQQRGNYLSLDNFSGDIKISSLTFSYPTKPEVEVLQNVSLTLQMGKKIAFIGESGSGKSTMAQLLLQFYDFQKGSIVIGDNDIPIQQFEKHEYRSQIAIVSQEPVLFATTMKENIKLGNQEVTDEEIISLLEQMNASELIEHLDKNVGTNGNQFSGGQKQRIALVRALISKPQLLILDEATSALDITNEQLVTKLIDDKFGSITRLVIAHRLSTIQNSDKIIVFHKGSIVGQGTHSELLEHSFHYQYLIKKQQQSQEEDQTKIQSLAHIEVDIFRTYQIQADGKSTIMEKSHFNKAKHRILDSEIEILNTGDKTPSKIRVDFEKKSSFRKNIQHLLQINLKELIIFTIACLSSLINGSIYPLFSQVLANFIQALLIHNPMKYFKQGNLELTQYQIGELNSSIDQSTKYFFILGFVYFFSTTVECLCFSVYSERLTIAMKIQMFKKYLRLPIQYYDQTDNNAGLLTQRITQDTRIIQQLFQNLIGFKCQYYSAMIVGFILAFIASWKLTLLSIGVAPIVYVGSKISQKYVVGSQSSFNEKTYAESNKILMETLTNIKTVYSLRAEQIILDQYHQLLAEKSLKSKKYGAYIGISSGYATMKPFLVNAYLFFMGTLLLVYDDLSVLGIYQTILAIIFAVVGGAKDVYFQSDNEKAKRAMNYYFHLLELQDEFQLEDKRNSPKLKEPISGRIEFRNVNFSYPQKPNIQVLRNLNLIIEASKHVGLVGASGCGKTTLFQLLLRLYTIDDGDILIDERSIYDYDLRYLRQQISIVSQEPQLFNDTIKNNIKYNLKSVIDEDIKQAAILSHAYDFIMQDLQQGLVENQGFEKGVGTKGSLISGGQKQRIAIARALLRNSSVYLFDEATSALDSNVETIVQHQLEEYLITKTSLIIAHRISTIKSSSVIYVFDQGQIIEQGKYEYLVKQKGHFYRLEQGLLHQTQTKAEIDATLIENPQFE